MSIWEYTLRSCAGTLVMNHTIQYNTYLEGLGHAILGNFSTDRMVIELTKISK